MRFVIATLPDVHFNLGRDLALLKTCAIYGDETVLFSPNYAFTSNLLDFSRRPLIHQLLYLAAIHGDPGFVVGEKLSPSERTARIVEAAARKADLLAKAQAVGELLPRADQSGEIIGKLETIAREVSPLVSGVERVWSDEDDHIKRAREIAKAETMGLVTAQSVHPVPSLYFDEDKLSADVTSELLPVWFFGFSTSDFYPGSRIFLVVLHKSSVLHA